MHQIVNSLDKKLVHLPRFNCHIVHSVNFKSNNSTFHNLHKLISEQVYYFIMVRDQASLFVYISIDWDSVPSNFSHWGDTRIKPNSDVWNLYSQELESPQYIHNVEFWKLFSQERN